MAYCPKCGVEVEDNVRSCPLCETDIPDVSENHDHGAHNDKRYPLAVNTYQDDHSQKKIQIFYALEIFFVAVLLVGIVLNLFFPVPTRISLIMIAVEVAAIFYVLFAFNFFPGWANLLGLAVTTGGLCYALYRIIGGSVNWFMSYALPIVIVVYLAADIFGSLLIKYSDRNRFVYIPACIIGFGVCVCLGVDGILAYAHHGTIDFDWSLVVAIAGTGSVAILLGVYHGVPDKTKAYLKRKFRA